MRESKKLTRLQRRWCERVNAGENGTQVLREMRPNLKEPRHAAYEYRQMPHIQDELNRLAAQAAHDAGLTVLKILTDIEELRKRCMQAEPVLDAEGKPTGEYKFSEHAALKASELQGKYLRMWSDKIELSGPNGGPVKIQRIERVIVKPSNTDG